MVLKVHKKLGYFDLALVSGIPSLAITPESLFLVRSVFGKVYGYCIGITKPHFA